MDKTTKGLSIVNKRKIVENASNLIVVILNDIRMIKVDQITHLSRDEFAPLLFEKPIPSSFFKHFFEKSMRN